MKPLSFKITSDHFLLGVFLSLLWGVTDSTTPASISVSTAARTSATAAVTTTQPPTTTKAPPGNVIAVEVETRSESSITLRWNKVNDITTYYLKYNVKGSSDRPEEDVINAAAGPSVTHVVNSLTAGTKYEFTLITAFEGANSTGYIFEAVTAPRNAEEFKPVDQTETSITLQWEKVDENVNYTIKYNAEEIDVTASLGQPMRATIQDLTNTTKYNFTLFTVFENVRSSGVSTTAATAPRNVIAVEVVTQSESSITLRWDKVNDITTYYLKYNVKGSSDRPEEDVITAAAGPSVTHVVNSLTAGTKYEFTLITVFEGLNSTGYVFEAVTAPGNVIAVEVVTQSESSITLRWNKVNDITTYYLQYEDEGSPKKDFINAAAGPSVTHVVNSLTAGTKYNFTLITAFEGLNSTGYVFEAVTVPRNAEEFKPVDQTETSITLQWKKVDENVNYTIKYNAEEIKVTASPGQPMRTIIQDLTNTTKYNFTLFTVFENVTSSGVSTTAATAPRNVIAVEVETRSESSITLRWDKVNDITTYYLKYNVKGSSDRPEEDVINAAADPSVIHAVNSLTAGTKYEFTLITVFEGLNSTGYIFEAVTVPRNAEAFKPVDQTETSITLQWEKVDENVNYTIKYNAEEIDVTASPGQPMRAIIQDLTNTTKYNFTLFTVFENVPSSGVSTTAATAPENVIAVEASTQNESSITLTWDKVKNIPTYYLQYEDKEETISVPQQDALVTYEVSPLTAGTKYEFTLITVFEGINSTGRRFAAVTAPRNTEELKSMGQNETSITLQWNKVNDILMYTLVYTIMSNEKEINFTASAEQEQVTQTVPELTSGTRYTFTLFTVFENVRSSGANTNAATAPRNTEELKSMGQNESSITLQWNRVNDILMYTLVYTIMSNEKEINVTASAEQEQVTQTVPELTSGTRYTFTLFTVFENVRSSGANTNAATVPQMVASVSVADRSVTSITLTWLQVNQDWNYFLQIDGSELLLSRSVDVVSRLISALQPGTEYPFSVITGFSGLNSTAYEDFTVTKIDCTKTTWRVTNSSIQGMVEGLFSEATATYKTQNHVSPGGRNVSFTHLYPGATYKVSLEYKKDSRTFPQCNHELTIVPPDLTARCEYLGSGYSMSIIWDEPEGVWTSVEVNVAGKQYNVTESAQISGFLPARTYEVSLASVSGSQRSNQYVFDCQTDPRGVIAGSVCAVLLFAVLVCLAVFIFLKRPDIISANKPFIGGSRTSNKKIKAISVAKFPDHFYQLGVDENRGFGQEYENLIPVGTEQTRKAALLPENKARNRFNNVLPYDWCRVRLTTSSPNETSDYINASYMPGYNSNREYIATQGPLPSTVDDFWRMIWEQRVKGIVMVTNCTEGGRTKCERYWPADSEPCPHGELMVTTRSEQQEPNWTLREFRLKHRNNSEERTVKHFHFTAWPDHGVPQGTGVLIQFRELVRRHIESHGAGAPTAVHCSAGVGRTGTIIALDVLLQQLEKERAAGINGFVHKMRLSRPHMVQTESQYVFLHQCIMDCLQLNEKAEENIYENADIIYANATALRELTHA